MTQRPFASSVVSAFFFFWICQIQVQTEIHVGAVTMDSDWRPAEFPYPIDGYSDDETAPERSDLPYCSGSGIQRQFSQSLSRERTQW